jgi:hypothetical protein
VNSVEGTILIWVSRLVTQRCITDCVFVGRYSTVVLFTHMIAISSNLFFRVDQTETYAME